MALKKPIIGEFLELYGFREILYEELKFRAGDEDFASYAAEAKQIRTRSEGIMDRRIELAWNAKALETLLSQRSSQAELVRRSIRGGEILGVSVCTTLGSPIRFVPPYEAKRISEGLKRIDLGSPEMPSGSARLQKLKEDFEKLSEFYNLAASHDEGVLTFSS